MGEHVVEATSARVTSTLAYRDELWDRSRHNDVAGESWLHGTFTYMLYRRPTNQALSYTSDICHQMELGIPQEEKRTEREVVMRLRQPPTLSSSQKMCAQSRIVAPETLIDSVSPATLFLPFRSKLPFA